MIGSELSNEYYIQASRPPILSLRSVRQQHSSAPCDRALRLISYNTSTTLPNIVHEDAWAATISYAFSSSPSSTIR